MFPGMKRKDREVSKERCMEVLKSCQYGIISTLGENGYPCGTPFSHVADDEKIYIHFGSGVPGNVMKSILNCNKVGFTCVGGADTIQSDFGMNYISVMVQGRAELIRGTDAEHIFRRFVDKYCPSYIKEGYEYAPKHMKAASIAAITIEHISGKSKDM
ncbi:MAG: pyridoxamine 5'-phosphate oxidase family protein [Eubacteriales bacterium]|nr:pyridoxamine 5'-phosphate oxidase family protein [Eubacteriales bacterium]